MTIRFALLAVLLAASSAAWGAADCTPKGFDVCKKAREISNELAPSLPMQLNANLTLQTVYAVGNTIGMTARMNYDSRLLQQALDGGKTSRSELAARMKLLADTSTCRVQSPTAAFVQLGGVVRHTYRFSDGTDFLSVDITECSSSKSNAPQTSAAADEQLLSRMTKDQAKAYFAEQCKRDGSCYPEGTLGASAKAACKKLVTDGETKSLRQAIPATHVIAYRQTSEDLIVYTPKDVKYGSVVVMVETITDVLIDGQVELQLRHQCHISSELKVLGVARVRAMPGETPLQLSYRKKGPDPIR